MSGTQEIVQIKPVDLRFPFELHKEIKSSFHILSKTNESVAFKVKSTNPKKYRVTPNHGLLQPDSDFNIVVTMYAQTEVPADMKCKDKFLVQAIIAPENTVVKNINDVTNIMKGPGKVHEVTLRVAYVQQSDREGSNADVFELSVTDIASLSRRGRQNRSDKLQEVKLEETVKRPPPKVHFGKPETIEEEEEEGEGEEKEETLLASSQNNNEMEALFRAEVQKRKKIEEELAKIRKESEENKKLVKELQQTLCCTQFGFKELKKATNGFDDKSCKIGQGGFSVVYKGILSVVDNKGILINKEVAIKKLTVIDEKGFNQEIETLSKVRHPNIITLIGACKDKENRVLVYEYLSEGSLEDHLMCKNDTAPLPGHDRIRIALEICCALSFLHSIPRAHADLKPDNVLLDSNFVSKLSDFGTSRKLEISEHSVTPSCVTVNVKGTFAYMDPDHLSSGRMNPQGDIYSFGVVLLRLATGKSASEAVERTKTPIRELVEQAIDENTFYTWVDGEWPYKEAPKKMADLGLKCLQSRRRRPDAASLFKSLIDIASNT